MGRYATAKSSGRPSTVITMAVALLLSLPWCAPDLAAHGGYPVSIAVRDDPALALVARLVLVYLREGQGMTVEPLFLPGGDEVQEAYEEGRADLIVDVPPEGWAEENCPPGPADAAVEAGLAGYYGTLFPGSWSAAFRFASEGQSCPPVLVAHRRVSEDLRFSLLQSTLERLLEAVGPSDMERLRREGAGGPREQTTAARRLLGEKGLL